MSEPTPKEQPEKAVEAEQKDQGDPGDQPLGENGTKALKAERDARAAAEKQAVALQKQLDEIAAAQLSDLERAQKEAADAKDAAAAALAEVSRFRVAAEFGIKENVDLILTAPDEETQRRQAALWASREATQDPSAGPRPDLTQGGSGNPPAKSNGEQFADFADVFFTK